MSEQASREVVVGRVGKPHGVRGEVTVEVRTDEPDQRLAVGAVLRVRAPQGSGLAHGRLTVDGVRRHQAGLLVHFAELPGRTDAEGARGVLLACDVDPEQRPEDPEEFYDHQLVGLAVHDAEQGTVLGEVTGVLHGAQDLLQVRTTDGREELVPFVAALVPEVDLDGARVTVADRPGLLSPLDDPAEEE